MLREASEFLLDFLVEDEQGRLVTNPSHSPENAFLDEKGNEGVLCVGATMDFGIIRELFGDCLRAAEVLGEDPDFRARLGRALDRLAALPDRQARAAAGVAEGLRRGRAGPPPHVAPLRPAPGPLDHAPGHAGAGGSGARLARAPAGAGRRRHGLEPRVDRQPLRPPRGRGAGARAPDDAAREVHPAEPVRQPPALPDRRQLRRHRRHRGDAAAEPRGRAGPAAGASPGVAGRQRHGPARARRLRGRPRLAGEASSSARSCGRSAASRAGCGTAEGPSRSTPGREGRSRWTARCGRADAGLALASPGAPGGGPSRQGGRP